MKGFINFQTKLPDAMRPFEQELVLNTNNISLIKSVVIVQANN